MKDSVNQLPLFRKAQEIYQTLITLTDLFPEDNTYLQHIKSHLLGDIMMIQAKISGAHAVKLYDIRMENAAIIRKAARDIMVGGNNLQDFGFADARYYRIIRSQIEEFRLLFVEWVAGFNPKHFIVDSWGLFNPPGISYDYVQGDDELDFLNEDENEDEDEDE
ncbi:hypothetical protein [uncultured Chryseobacterium sp.]|uniref:hypothetical protein n=1 Tax=uncultured Chryseobacterium sp. TaxID=259322 RepID=UPI0025DE4635|nr:hypothetical protein [uncultured Chryseobacterium sp.]